MHWKPSPSASSLEREGERERDPFAGSGLADAFTHPLLCGAQCWGNNSLAGHLPAGTPPYTIRRKNVQPTTNAARCLCCLGDVHVRCYCHNNYTKLLKAPATTLDYSSYPPNDCTDYCINTNTNTNTNMFTYGGLMTAQASSPSSPSSSNYGSAPSPTSSTSSSPSANFTLPTLPANLPLMEGWPPGAFHRFRWCYVNEGSEYIWALLLQPLLGLVLTVTDFCKADPNATPMIAASNVKPCASCNIPMP